MNTISFNHQRFDTADLKPAEVAQLVMLASRLTTVSSTCADIDGKWTSVYYTEPLTVSLSRETRDVYSSYEEASQRLEDLRFEADNCRIVSPAA